jgi:hypothetical protein
VDVSFTAPVIDMLARRLRAEAMPRNITLLPRGFSGAPAIDGAQRRGACSTRALGGAKANFRSSLVVLVNAVGNQV